MYFNYGKQLLVDLTNSRLPSNPISSNSNLEELKSFAISPYIITVSEYTMLSLSSDNNEVILIGSNNGTLSNNLDFKLVGLQ